MNGNQRLIVEKTAMKSVTKTIELLISCFLKSTIWSNHESLFSSCLDVVSRLSADSSSFTSVFLFSSVSSVESSCSFFFFLSKGLKLLYPYGSIFDHLLCILGL